MKRPAQAILWTIAIALGAAARANAETFGLTHAASVYADAKGEPLKAPEGIACAGAGRVMVADSGNGRLLTFDYKDGAFSSGEEVKGARAGHPSRVEVDGKGNVLVLDLKARRIVRIGADGVAAVVETSGVPPASGYFPIAFKLDRQGAIYVLDAASARAVVLEASGRFVRQLLLPEGAKVTDLAIDAQGGILALDGSNSMVYSAAAGASSFVPFSKGLAGYMNHGGYLTTTEEGLVLIVDQHGNGIVVLAPDGSYLGRRLGIGWSDGLVYYPSQICLDKLGHVFVADRNNNRVQAFTVTR